MAKRKLSKSARFERMYRILEYLKKNTDRDHPTTQAKMREAEDEEMEKYMEQYIGNKETFNRLIKDMARTMNSDEDGRCKSEAEWKIFFDDFKRLYGDNADIESEEQNADKDYDEFLGDTMRIKGLYYNRTFSYEEIDMLIEGVLAARTIDTKTAHDLIEKIEENLTTKFYKKNPKQICKVREPELLDRKTLRENILTIQSAIDDNVQISFQFNGYSHRNKLEHMREERNVVSPYYVVVSGGRYYLLACTEFPERGESSENMSIWRIDLMTDIEFYGANGKRSVLGAKRTPKRKVKNLPLEWNEDFQLKHLNMSFDKPEKITLRIRTERSKDDPAKRARPDYTFMHDFFGNNFRYMRSEEEAPYDDIVQVECSPYGMVNWALQYSDRVEVVAPEHVREKVIKKVRALNEKYGVG